MPGGHAPHGFAGAQHWTDGVRHEHPQHAGRVHLFEPRLFLKRGGVVDEHAGYAKFAFHAFEQGDDVAFDGDVRLHGESPDLVGERFGGGCVPEGGRWPRRCRVHHR